MARWIAPVAAFVLVTCSASGHRADEQDLVDAYVLAIRARESGKTEGEVQAAVDVWLHQEGLTREDLVHLTKQLDERPEAWARVWARIDERLRAAPES